MATKSNNIVSYTDTELKAMQARGESQTDWARAATIPLPDGSDPDDAMEEIDWAVTELPAVQKAT